MGSNVEMGKTVDGNSARTAHTLFKCSRMGVESTVTHLYVGGGARHEVAPGTDLLTPCSRFENQALIAVLVRESAKYGNQPWATRFRRLLVDASLRVPLEQ